MRARAQKSTRVTQRVCLRGYCIAPRLNVRAFANGESESIAAADRPAGTRVALPGSMCGTFVPRCEPKPRGRACAPRLAFQIRSKSSALDALESRNLKLLEAYGNICFVFSMSALLTSVSFFSLRMRPGAFVPSMWRLPACERMILPVAVTLNRFAAPRCVFNFNFGFEAFLGIAKSSLHTATPCLNPNAQNRAISGCLTKLAAPVACAGFAGTGAPFFGASNATNTLPSMRGIVSIWQYSRDFSQQPRHLRAAHFLVRHFASAMKNHRAHFVAFTQKPDDLILAHVVVVFGGCRPKFYFFQLRAAAAFALLVRFFVLLIKKFAVVRDFANGRIGCRRNLHQIQSLFARHSHRFVRLHDAKLAAFFIDHPDFTSPDAFVHSSAVALLPEVTFCDNSP